LAYQTGLPQTAVDAKVRQLTNDFNAAVKRVGEKAAHAAGDAGWAMFVLLIAGLCGSAFGGRTGALANNQRPFARSYGVIAPKFQATFSEHGSVLPYVAGWLLGVPISILFLIALFRTVF
jgi:hypothetical protein